MTQYNFTIDTPAILPPDRARVFYDGIFDTPKLSHPEGVAVAADGSVWCGNQDGDILRIAPDGGAMEKIAGTGGFTLGFAFDGDAALYACDLKHAAVFKLDLATRALTKWTADGLKIPNYPCLDKRHGRLLVSDSHAFGEPGPGIFAFDLETGAATLWYDRALNFANGLALAPDGSALYVCETFAPSITRIPINADGSAGAAETFANDLPGLPDGIAFDRQGNLVVGCYEPSRILRIAPDGAVSLLIEDITAHTLAHPTNISFRDDTLFTANLGRWHIAAIDMDIGGDTLARTSP